MKTVLNAYPSVPVSRKTSYSSTSQKMLVITNHTASAEISEFRSRVAGTDLELRSPLLATSYDSEKIGVRCCPSGGMPINARSRR